MSGHQLRPPRRSLPGPWFSSVLSRVAHSSEMLTQDIDGPQAEQLELSPMDRHSKMNHIFLILEIKETFPIYICRKAPWKWGVISNGEWWHPTWASQVGLVRKNPSANAGNIRDVGSIPGLGRSPGGGHGNTLQYSCLENPMDRGAWQAVVHRVTKSRTRLSTYTHIHTHTHTHTHTHVH